MRAGFNFTIKVAAALIETVLKTLFKFVCAKVIQAKVQPSN